MSLRIEVFNAGFGDCFRIENEKSNMIVDFGIHQNTYFRKKGKRKEIHEKIAKSIKELKKPTLLITHYHDDHISGLLYMMKYYSKEKLAIFEKVYIPDIWNISSAPKIIAALLLEEQMKNAKLSKSEKSVTLFELMKFLCSFVENTVPLKRGQSFEDDNYLALWPDLEYISANTKLILPRFSTKDIDKLIEISNQLRKVMTKYFNMENHLRDISSVIYEIEKIERVYWDWSNSIDFKSRDEDAEYLLLNGLANSISIVFQNKYYTKNQNILFTGDVESKFLKKVLSNYDQTCSIHETIDFIKIPHHGTKGVNCNYYYDFGQYKPRYYIISNGGVNYMRFLHNYIFAPNKQKHLNKHL